MNKTIQWIKSQELPTGGIAAWPGAASYPECTGYLIPTLFRYNEFDLAHSCGEWLKTIQNSDGSFNGIDHTPRAFDTAAIMEGLEVLEMDAQYLKAKAFMETQLVDTANGQMLRESPNSAALPAYNIRALAIMGRKLEDYAWIAQRSNPERSHYFLYALEGLWNMGYQEFVRGELDYLKIDRHEGLLPNLVNGGGSDTCATAQAACLRLRAGMDADEYIDAVNVKLNPDGSLPHDNRDSRKNSWACKYWLDALWILENGSE